jgi:cysteine desulfurase family protein
MEIFNPQEIYLNNAATSWPKPDSVITAVQKHLLSIPGESGRSTDELSHDPIQEAREICADFFACSDPDHIIFTSGATESLNLIIHGFAASHQDPFHVITTDLDHNSVLRPLYTLVDQKKIELTIVRSEDGYVSADAIADTICENTQMIVINQGSNVLGTVQNIKDISNVKEGKEIFILADGSQTAGQIPIQIPDLGVDGFVFTGHKYLFGIAGFGGFWIRNPDSIVPIKQGGTGTNSKNLRQPDNLPERFESGTPNYPGAIALIAGITYIQEKGFSQIASHVEDCIQAFYNPLTDVEEVIQYSPSPDIPVFPINIKGIDNDTAGFILRTAYGIISRTGLHCAPLIHEQLTKGEGCVRLSPSILTDPEHCQYAGEMIRDISQKVMDKISK